MTYKNKSGFTLLELVIVVVLISVIALVCIPAMKRSHERNSANSVPGDLISVSQDNVTFEYHPTKNITGEGIHNHYEGSIYIRCYDFTHSGEVGLWEMELVERDFLPVDLTRWSVIRVEDMLTGRPLGFLRID